MELTREGLKGLLQRRQAGESMPVLATEAGVPWQRLWMMLYGPGGALYESGCSGQVDEAQVMAIVDRVLKERMPARVVEVRHPDGRKIRLEGRTHKQFEAVVGLVCEGHRNILLVGPAGSGKTRLAQDVAKALDVPFGFLSLSAGVTETHLFGRLMPQTDGTWNYQPSRFVKVYENGGVFLLDEIDAADPNVLVAVNAAMANGFLANPNGRVHVRHPNCYIIGAANTWGQGGDLMYVGRNQLDAATLDRFVLAMVLVEYDTALEAEIAQALLPEPKAGRLLAWVGTLRERITENRLRRVASTRLVANGAAALAAGASLNAVRERYFQNWTADERAKVGN